MSTDENLVFPELIDLNDFGGDFDDFLAEAYTIFEQDFIKSNPIFEGVNVAVRRYPEMDGMHKTFYHITHEGEDESERTPDLRRIERIRFPKFMIDNNSHKEILLWKNKRGKDERTILFNEEENYIVVLTDRGQYYMFITAYLVEQEHRKRKLLKEYEAYKNAKTA